MSNVKKEYLKDKDGEIFSPIYSLCSLKFPNDNLIIKYNKDKKSIDFNFKNTINYQDRSEIVYLDRLPKTHIYNNFFEISSAGSQGIDEDIDMKNIEYGTFGTEEGCWVFSKEFNSYHFSPSDVNYNSYYNHNDIPYFITLGYDSHFSQESGWDNLFEKSFQRCVSGQQYTLFIECYVSVASSVQFVLSCASAAEGIKSFTNSTTMTSNTLGEKRHIVFNFTYIGNSNGTDYLTVNITPNAFNLSKRVGLAITDILLVKGTYSTIADAKAAYTAKTYNSVSTISLTNKGELICNKMQEIDNE